MNKVYVVIDERFCQQEVTKQIMGIYTDKLAASDKLYSLEKEFPSTSEDSHDYWFEEHELLKT